MHDLSNITRTSLASRVSAAISAAAAALAEVSAAAVALAAVLVDTRFSVRQFVG